MNDIEREKEWERIDREAAIRDIQGTTQNNFLRDQLKQAREWHAGLTSGAIGGGPFNTEGLRLMVTAHVQLLETLVEGKPTAKMPSRHHV